MKIEKIKRILKEKRIPTNKNYERVDNETSDDSYQESCSSSGQVSSVSRLERFFSTIKTKVSSNWKDCKHTIQQFPPDIYWIFCLKFLEAYSYFALSQILVIYLHTEFEVSDIEAGMVYGMWGAAITLWGLLISWMNDNLGVKKSLTIGFAISAISSTIVASTSSKTFLYFTIFALYPIGTCMGIPMLTVAIKRYTTPKRRGFAFGLFYSVMNVAALISGPVVDILNVGIQNGLTIGSVHLSGNRLVILTCTLSNLISLYIAVRFIREIKLTDDDDDDVEVNHDDDIEARRDEEGDGEESKSSSREVVRWRGGIEGGRRESTIQYTIDSDEEGEEQEERQERKEQEQCGNGIELVQLNNSPSRDEVPSNESTNPHNHTHTHTHIQEYTPTQHNPYDTIRELLRSPTFWRFACFTLLLVNLNAIFRHLDATEPTYLLRCFGPNVPKGTLYSINPFMIIFLTPLVAMFTSTFNHFDMIKWGGYLTAASPIFPALSTTIWAVVAMNVLLSLGEAIWSPRLYDYVMTIAPEGKEASFSALATAPLFAAKIPVGLMSGYLLATYLPEEGKQQPKKMWIVICLLTMTSPILITLFDPCIREPSHSKVPSSPSISSSSPSSDQTNTQSTLHHSHNHREDEDPECSLELESVY